MKVNTVKTGSNTTVLVTITKGRGVAAGDIHSEQQTGVVMEVTCIVTVQVTLDKDMGRIPGRAATFKGPCILDNVKSSEDNNKK